MRVLSLVVPGVLALTLLAPIQPASGGEAVREQRPTVTLSGARPVSPDASDVAGRRFGGRWPGRRITYSDKLSPSYDWALKHAVAAWNKGSGAKIKFVRAAKGKRGDVLIKRAPTPGHAGQATLGHVPNAWVHLAPGIGKNIKREDWILTSVLIAHELGHVLNLNHSNRTASLMYPYVPNQYVDQGKMTCRWVTKPDAKAAIRLYGGSVNLAPKLCKVEKFAPALIDVTATGGFAEGTPVTLTWEKPSGIPPQSHIYVQVNYPDDCEADGFFRKWDRLSSTATSWTDTEHLYEEGAYCYTVVLQNYWGGGAPRYNSTPI